MMAQKKRKTHGLKRFTLVAAVLVAYTAFAVHSYGVQDGLSVTALTWAFFVFATPIADAGFLIAFPVRLITGFRMLYTQLIVWAAGIVLVAAYMLANTEVFAKTPVLQLFHDILTTPWPLGIILLLSAVGTYVSIRFDDDVLDVAMAKNRREKLHANRLKLYSTIGIFVATFGLYVVLLQLTNTHIDIF